VRGIDTASWNNKRLAGVAFAFQVRKHRVEFHIDDSSNILAKHPTGSCFFDNSEHLWPERTVIFCAPSLPGNRERLARKPSGNKVNCFKSISSQVVNIGEDKHLRPMFLQDSLAVVVNFAKRKGFILVAPGPLCG